MHTHNFEWQLSPDERGLAYSLCECGKIGEITCGKCGDTVPNEEAIATTDNDLLCPSCDTKRTIQENCHHDYHVKKDSRTKKCKACGHIENEANHL